MVFGETLKLRHRTAEERERAVVGSRHIVSYVDVDVSLLSVPQKRGRVGLADPETQAVVEKDEIG